jgi:hypothetical protein
MNGRGRCDRIGRPSPADPVGCLDLTRYVGPDARGLAVLPVIVRPVLTPAVEIQLVNAAPGAVQIPPLGRPAPGLAVGTGKAVADLLGHSPIAVTGDIYGHTSDDTARAAVDGLIGTLGL